MKKLDSIRSSLYNQYKPKFEMKDELNIVDQLKGIDLQHKNYDHSLVATKKVTQIRAPPSMQSTIKAPPQESQPEILEEIERDTKLIQSMELPPSGQLVRPVPNVDDFVFTMKHPLVSWIKGKV